MKDRINDIFQNPYIRFINTVFLLMISALSVSLKMNIDSRDKDILANKSLIENTKETVNDIENKVLVIDNDVSNIHRRLNEIRESELRQEEKLDWIIQNMK